MSEIDLHGLTLSEAIAAFVAAYNRATGTLRVVHGYGSSGTGGVIKRNLRAFLDEHADRLHWFAGEKIDGNPGYTLVQILKPLPTPMDRLEAGILEYCATPRTEEKIAGKFRGHTAREVKDTIRRLKGQGRLREILKAGRTVYQI